MVALGVGMIVTYGIFEEAERRRNRIRKKKQQDKMGRTRRDKTLVQCLDLGASVWGLSVGSLHLQFAKTIQYPSPPCTAHRNTGRPRKSKPMQAKLIFCLGTRHRTTQAAKPTLVKRCGLGVLSGSRDSGRFQQVWVATLAHRLTCGLVSLFLALGRCLR